MTDSVCVLDRERVAWQGRTHGKPARPNYDGEYSKHRNPQNPMDPYRL
jgi:hypothetical protein